MGKMHLEIDMCQKKSFLGEVIHIIELLLRYSFRYFFECSELFYGNISIPKTWTKKLGKRRKIKTFNKKFFNLFFAEVFGEMDLHSHYRNISSELKSEKNVGNFFLNLRPLLPT